MARPHRTRSVPAGLLVAAVLLGLAGAGGLHLWRRAHATAAAPTRAAGIDADIRRAARILDTAHYRITSTADPAQAARVGTAVESLHAAWRATFPEAPPARAEPARLQLVLYRDRDQFKAHNRSSPWAEAFYRTPYSHAYYAAGEANPTHWMVHEATHQLSREVARFPRAKWSDEGLAAYFAASRIVDGTLQPGSIDPHAYPIWWLPRLAPSGDLAADARAGRFIPLRALLDDTGPDIGQHFNLYYVEYWSLVHFLLHARDGAYADGFRRLLREGGAAAAFERDIGPIDRIEGEWYADLRRQADVVRAMQAGAWGGRETG